MSVEKNEAANAAPRERILATAGAQVLREGYSGLNMDRLSETLGMSKKTLYVHFPGKDAILRAIVERISTRLRSRMDTLLADRSMDFPTRLRAVVGTVFGTLTKVNPTLFRDLKRYAPSVYAVMDEVRSRTVPHVFGTLLREGIEGGYVREEIDVEFAAFAWLQLIRGLVEPDALERTGLTPRQSVEKAFHLMWPGLLTENGREALGKETLADGEGVA